MIIAILISHSFYISSLVRSENSLRKICSSSSSYCKNEDHPDPTKTAEPQQPDNKNPKLKLSQLIQSMSKV